MKRIELVCLCGKKFERPLIEHNRSKKLNRAEYCSRECAGKAATKFVLPYAGRNSKYDISKHSANQKDEYTPFRTHLNRARRRSKEVTATLDDLKKQWEKQNGICAYTKVKLQFPHYKHANDIIHTASLDRIDSNRGYVADNIQWISMVANFAKQSMTHEQMLEFVKIVKESE